jgi:hypothetical protein
MAYEVAQTCLLVPVNLDPDECASWVQAWGTVLAVIAAGGIAWWQQRNHWRKEAKRQAEAFAARVALIGIATVRAEVLLLQHRSDARQVSPNAYKTAVPLIAVLAAALDVDFPEMPTPTAVHALLNWRLAAQEWRLLLDRNGQNHWMDQRDMEAWQEALGKADHQLGKLWTELASIDPDSARAAESARSGGNQDA